MTPSIIRTVNLIAGIAAVAVAFTVVKDPTARMSISGAGFTLIGMGGGTVHDAGHITIFGMSFAIPGFVQLQPAQAEEQKPKG